MLCENCKKLAVLPQNIRKCIRCQSTIPNNLSCICDACSDQNGLCSICLKKVHLTPKPKKSSGCGCGKK